MLKSPEQSTRGNAPELEMAGLRRDGLGCVGGGNMALDTSEASRVHRGAGRRGARDASGIGRRAAKCKFRASSISFSRRAACPPHLYSPMRASTGRDDGSQCLRVLAAKASRFRVKRPVNRSASGARQLGSAEASPARSPGPQPLPWVFAARFNAATVFSCSRT